VDAITHLSSFDSKHPTELPAAEYADG
jgi:hypothetical protein